MRAPLLVAASAALCLALAPARAQTGPPAPPPDTSLAIPMPAGAQIQFEVDARDEDILGVFKSLLKGFTSPPEGAAHPGAKPSLDDPFSLLTNTNLADVLKNVSHVHAVLLSAPGSKKANTAALPDSPRTAALGRTLRKAVLVALPGQAPSPSAETPDQGDFYETAFTQEGGHRILYANAGGFHVLMSGFGHGAGFALVMQFPGQIAVVRADGYPDFSKLSALVPMFAGLAKSFNSDSSSDETHTPAATLPPSTAPAPPGKAPAKKLH